MFSFKFHFITITIILTSIWDVQATGGASTSGSSKPTDFNPKGVPFVQVEDDCIEFLKKCTTFKNAAVYDQVLHSKGNAIVHDADPELLTELMNKFKQYCRAPNYPTDGTLEKNILNTYGYYVTKTFKEIDAPKPPFKEFCFYFSYNCVRLFDNNFNIEALSSLNIFEE